MPEYQFETGAKSKAIRLAPMERQHADGLSAHFQPGLSTGAALVGNDFPARLQAIQSTRPNGPRVPFRESSLLQLQRRYGNRYVQRVIELARHAEGNGAVTPEVETRVESARGSGQSLDHTVRQQMEPAFGADFSGVRIHTGAQAHSLSAASVTAGQDIFFRDGAYSPETSGGKELLAHELTHVVQQGGGHAVHGKLILGDANDPYEQEADAVARQVVASTDIANPWQAHSSSDSPSGSVQRQCACSGQTASGGECEDCRQKREASVKRSIMRQAERTVQRQEPFEPAGTDNASCKDKINEDGAVCADHANTMCSVTGAGLGGSAALIGAGIGTMIFPGAGTLIGAGAGLLLGGIGGAYTYGKCVEKMNAACRAKTRQGLGLCGQKFPPEVDVENLPHAPTQIPEVNVEDLPQAE